MRAPCQIAQLLCPSITSHHAGDANPGVQTPFFNVDSAPIDTQ